MFMVMSATTLDGSSRNCARCFETNATGLATMVEAETEADRRNVIERAAGHFNVEWYATEQLDIAAIMAMMKKS